MSDVDSFGTPVKVYYHVTLTKNWPSIQKSGLIPKKEKRGKGFEDGPEAVYLFNTEDEAEDGTANWLGDLYDEDEELSLLKVSVPLDSPIRIEPDQELDLSASVALDPIPAKMIAIKRKEF